MKRKIIKAPTPPNEEDSRGVEEDNDNTNQTKAASDSDSGPEDSVPTRRSKPSTVAATSKRIKSTWSSEDSDASGESSDKDDKEEVESSSSSSSSSSSASEAASSEDESEEELEELKELRRLEAEFDACVRSTVESVMRTPEHSRSTTPIPDMPADDDAAATWMETDIVQPAPQEESDCIVCFSQYDGEEHRPRSMPCGHTMCSKCLERAISEESKMCPKCRTPYAASNIEELPVNFSLEGIVKSLKISDITKDSQIECTEHQVPLNGKSSGIKIEKVPECPEHQLPVSIRCSAHKAWICQSCLIEDHSSEKCKIITINAELANKKSRQLDLAEPFLNGFKKSSQKAEDCLYKCKKQIEGYEEDISRYESTIVRLQEEIQNKKNAREQVKEMVTMFVKKLENVKNISSFGQATTALECSESIREVSRCSADFQNETVKLQSITQDIENEVDKILQVLMNNADHLLGYHKLSVRDGRPHLHDLQEDTYKSSPELQYTDENDPPLTDGIMTFLDVAWPGKEPQRVYIKMVGNTAIGRQHLLLVTGQCGHSYKGVSFNKVLDKDKPTECLITSAYDGKDAVPLLKNLAINDLEQHTIKAGLLCNIYTKGKSSTKFGVFLKDITDNIFPVFGQVTSGLEILQDIAKSNEKGDIKIVDCGVVLSW